jgi:hypothetical protein
MELTTLYPIPHLETFRSLVPYFPKEIRIPTHNPLTQQVQDPNVTFELIKYGNITLGLFGLSFKRMVNTCFSYTFIERMPRTHHVQKDIRRPLRLLSPIERKGEYHTIQQTRQEAFGHIPRVLLGASIPFVTNRVVNTLGMR